MNANVNPDKVVPSTEIAAQERLAAERKAEDNKEEKGLVLADTAAESAPAKQEPEVVGVFTHELSKPLVYDGAELTSLTFDFASLNGEDICNIDAQLQAKNKIALEPSVSREFQLYLAAFACREGVDSVTLRKLPIGDFMAITRAARDFLLA